MENHKLIQEIQWISQENTYSCFVLVNTSWDAMKTICEKYPNATNIQLKGTPIKINKDGTFLLQCVWEKE